MKMRILQSSITAILSFSLIISINATFAENENNTDSNFANFPEISDANVPRGGFIQVLFATDPAHPYSTNQTNLEFDFVNKEMNSIQQDVDYQIAVNSGPNQLYITPVTHSSQGSVILPFRFQSAGQYQIIVDIYGMSFKKIPPENTTFTLTVLPSSMSSQATTYMPQNNMPQNQSIQNPISLSFNQTGKTLAQPSVHIDFDKTSYSPGDTVIIHAESINSSSVYRALTLKILDATTDLEGTYSIYNSTQNLFNGTATFNYTIPQFVNQQTTYRYLVQIYQDGNACCPLGSAYFVTLPDANHLAVDHLKVLTTKVIPGQAINFTALVRDGVGTPVKNLVVKADLPQSDEINLLSANATLNSSSGLYVGTIPIPKNLETQLPVQYYLLVTVRGPPDMTFTPAEYRGGIVNIIPATVPEFPFAIPVLLASITSLIIFSRINARK